MFIAHMVNCLRLRSKERTKRRAIELEFLSAPSNGEFIVFVSSYKHCTPDGVLVRTESLLELRAYL